MNGAVYMLGIFGFNVGRGLDRAYVFSDSLLTLVIGYPIKEINIHKLASGYFV
jgi:hypothetical protein